MSRKGECLDNAVAESFFGSLKNELVYHEDYKTRSEARQSVFENDYWRDSNCGHADRRTIAKNLLKMRNF